MKQSESSSELLKGILETAEAEARNILETAGSRAEETIESAREKAAKILNEAERKARVHRKEVQKNSGSSLSLLQSRQELKNSQKLYNEVQNRVRRKIKELRESNSYRTVLMNFIVEAALGLSEESDDGSFIINGGAPERDLMDPLFLTEVQRQLKTQFNVNHSFILSSETALSESGVEISDSSGRRAFSNSFSARMLRYEEQIKELIENRLHEVESSPVSTPDLKSDSISNSISDMTSDPISEENL